VNRPILDPNRNKGAGTPAAQMGEQLGALLREAALSGLAVGVANLLAEFTMSDGPWLLHRDGTVTDPGEP
jgi:hypothetical protein